MIVPDVLTLEETANYLRLSEETIERQAVQGQIPGRRIEDTWRFLKAAIDDWLQSYDSRMLLRDILTPTRSRFEPARRISQEDVKRKT